MYFLTIAKTKKRKYFTLKNFFDPYLMALRGIP